METDASQGETVANARALRMSIPFIALADAEAICAAWKQPITCSAVSALRLPLRLADSCGTTRWNRAPSSSSPPTRNGARWRCFRSAPARNGVRTASFLGGKHATFNMPLLSGTSQPPPARPRSKPCSSSCARNRRQADLLALARNRRTGGASSIRSRCCPASRPSTLPAAQAGAQDGPDRAISNSIRRRLKSKERKLQPLPGFRYLAAQTDDEIRRILDAFFTIKPQRMAIQKLPMCSPTPASGLHLRDVPGEVTRRRTRDRNPRAGMR